MNFKSQRMIFRYLNLINKLNKRCRVVLHDLTDFDIQPSIQICMKLLKNPLDEPFVRRIITYDDSCIFFISYSVRSKIRHQKSMIGLVSSSSINREKRTL